MSHVCTITIDNTKVSADATDFPVYVDLSDLPASFWDVVANGGGDIRVFKSDDTTELPREVVSCDTATDTGELHFKYSGTLSSSADTDVHIYADGVSSDYAVTATYGRNAVWSAENAVFHFNNVTDSTGNNSPTAFGSPAYGTSYGKFGTGIQLTDSTSKYISTGMSYSTGNTVKSYRAWVYFNSLVDYNWAIAGGTDVNDKAFGFFNVKIADGNKFYHHGNGASADYIFTNTPAATTWYYIAASYDGVNTNSLYLNGSLNGTKVRALDTGSSTILIGKRQSNTFPFDGNIDEVRLRNGTVSADWITTEYNNQNSPSTFYSAAAAGGGGGTTYNALAFCSF